MPGILFPLKAFRFKRWNRLFIQGACTTTKGVFYMLGKYYNAREAEKSMQEFWKSEDIYKFVPDAREVFSIDTPPPTVSGSLHIGHIFSYTQAEIIARFKRMQGKNVFYPFGFDDNGLPSERLTEKERKLTAFTLPRSEFTALCRETAGKYVSEFQKLWQTMGFSVDWKLKYETISPFVQKLSQKSFIRLAKKALRTSKRHLFYGVRTAGHQLHRQSLKQRKKSQRLIRFRLPLEIRPCLSLQRGLNSFSDVSHCSYIRKTGGSTGL